MTKFRDGAFGPTIILFLICAVITLSLAFTYDKTYPIIRQGEIDAANLIRSQVLPGGESFTQITGKTLPEGVLEVYRADNDSGFVFSAQAKGFSGMVTFMIGIDKDGGVTGINMFNHNETPGLGTKIAQPDYLHKYFGQVDVSSVDVITGASRTSNALKNSLEAAKEAFELMKGDA